jgi:hypothetical protein
MRMWRQVILTLALVCAPMASPGGPIITDANWVNNFPAPQFSSGPIETLTLDSRGILYVGGTFGQTGNVPAAYVAKWDGTNWSALGTGVGDYVLALLADKAGNVYVGEDFPLPEG